MTSPQDYRKMVDNLAQETVDRAQEMLRTNPGITPTTAYKLAISYTLETTISSMALHAAQLQKELAAAVAQPRVVRRTKRNGGN